MKEIIHNYYNLNDKDINNVVTRVKVLMINSKQELLLGYSHKTYQFPGGHLEENESLEDCVKRELLEETGIKVETTNLKPFFLIKHYTKDYPKERDNSLYLIYYYVIRTDDKYILENTNYTTDEKDGNFSLVYVNISDIEKLLIESIPDNKVNKVIVEEMLLAINEYKKLLL